MMIHTGHAVHGAWKWEVEHYRNSRGEERFQVGAVAAQITAVSLVGLSRAEAEALYRALGAALQDADVTKGVCPACGKEHDCPPLSNACRHCGHNLHAPAAKARLTKLTAPLNGRTMAECGDEPLIAVAPGERCTCGRVLAAGQACDKCRVEAMPY